MEKQNSLIMKIWVIFNNSGKRNDSLYKNNALQDFFKISSLLIISLIYVNFQGHTLYTGGQNS